MKLFELFFPITNSIEILYPTIAYLRKISLKNLSLNLSHTQKHKQIFLLLSLTSKRIQLANEAVSTMKLNLLKARPVKEKTFLTFLLFVFVNFTFSLRRFLGSEFVVGIPLFEMD